MVIETLRPEQVHDAAQALAESFALDPVYDHVFTDRRRGLPALRGFLSAPFLQMQGRLEVLPGVPSCWTMRRPPVSESA